MKSKLHLDFGGYSDAGVKPSNEDAFTAVMPTEHSVRKYKGAVACIADGVSCSDNAQVASQTAATNFASDYYSTPDFWTVKHSASKVIGSINSWLYQQGRQHETCSDGYITTFSALIIKSHTAHILHTGDSRIYLLRDNQLELLTTDHFYQRGGEQYLTRALGIEGHLELDYRSLKVKVGDRFLLSTDGVHDVLSHKQLAKLASSTETDLEVAAKAIGQAALEKGSEDNISCLLADVVTLPVERLEEAYQNLQELIIPPIMAIGNKIDNFEVIRILHSGTRSHVYLARDLITDKKRVLKMPSENFSDDAGYLEGFAREEWIGRKLAHPQIMKVFAPPQNTKFLYHVCEYIEGSTLRQWMLDNQKPNLDQVREILAGMIVPVRALHRDKMVHRDLKPENFMINRDGVVSLIDFGTMQISGVDEIQQINLEEAPVGDVGYIAPEYLVYGAVNEQSDLFSIATIVYEMITGKLPFNAVKSNIDYPKKFDKWNYIALNMLAQPPEDIPEWTDRVLNKALEPNPENRYQALSEFQSDLQSPSQEILKSLKFIPFIERNPLRFWQTLSVVLMLVVIAQWGFYFRA